MTGKDRGTADSSSFETVSSLFESVLLDDEELPSLAKIASSVDLMLRLHAALALKKVDLLQGSSFGLKDVSRMLIDNISNRIKLEKGDAGDIPPDFFAALEKLMSGDEKELPGRFAVGGTDGD